MNWLTEMVHNAMLICKAEEMINRCLANGMMIYLKNPDGTQIRLQQGISFITVEKPEVTE